MPEPRPTVERAGRLDPGLRRCGFRRPGRRRADPVDCPRRGRRARPRGAGPGHRRHAREGLCPPGRPASRAGALSFHDVVTYNLDEYYPIGPLDPKSYRSYMHRHLFGHVDIAPNQRPLLDGTVPESFAAEHAAEFDRWIAADGGLDLQLLGIGRNGHIGFNEPSDLAVADALAAAHPAGRAPPGRPGPTRRGISAAKTAVIPRALTMGVATILAARSILMLATAPTRPRPSPAPERADDGRVPGVAAPVGGPEGHLDSRRGRRCQAILIR